MDQAQIDKVLNTMAKMAKLIKKQGQQITTLKSDVKLLKEDAELFTVRDDEVIA